MNNFANIISCEDKSCCPKIIVYSEDFYMFFGNCQNHLDNCICENFPIWKKLFLF